MFTKSIPVTHVKAGEADGLPEGVFEAFVSVFGVKDSYGDVVMPGAFVETLAAWKDSGNPIPVIWSHGYFDLANHIGYLTDAEEREIDGKAGLWVRGQLDVGPDAEDAQARKAAKLLKGKRVTQFSFSYDILDAGAAKSDELGDYYELRKLWLFEVGPCLIGANQETDLLGVKALAELAVEIKAGRVLSAKNEESLRTAHEAIGRVLAALEDSGNDDGKATSVTPAKDDEPSRAKSEEPAAAAPADLSELQALDLDLAVHASA